MASQVAKVTSKGQVTIPKRIRQELDINKEDYLLLTVEGGRLVATPMRRKQLRELYGALPATREFPGSDKVRDEIHKELGERIARGEE